MIKGIEKIRAFIEQSNCPLWTIRRTEKGAPVYSSEVLINGANKKEGTLPSLDEALRFFDTVIPSLEQGFYFIECYNKVTVNNDLRYKDSIVIGNDAMPQQSNTIAGMSGLYTQQQLDEKINSVISKLESERIIKELSARLATLEAEKPDNLELFIGKIAPYTDKILGGIFGNPAPATAIAIGNTTTEKNEDMQQALKDRLYKAINIWNANEPDMVDIVEKIAAMAAKKDTMYMMVKSNLLKK